MIGRAMTDVEKMSGTFELAPKEHGFSVLIGKAPVSEIQNYPKKWLPIRKDSAGSS